MLVSCFLFDFRFIFPNSTWSWKHQLWREILCTCPHSVTNQIDYRISDFVVKMFSFDRAPCALGSNSLAPKECLLFCPISSVNNSFFLTFRPIYMFIFVCLDSISFPLVSSFVSFVNYKLLANTKMNAAHEWIIKRELNFKWKNPQTHTKSTNRTAWSSDDCRVFHVDSLLPVIWYCYLQWWCAW